MWPYSGESGPYDVHRYDLELDGKPGLDCVIRIGDPQDTHCEFLVYLSRDTAWKFAGFIEAGNNIVGPPAARTESTPSGRSLLVITQTMGNQYYQTETWFEVSGSSIRQCFTHYNNVVQHEPKTHPLAIPVYVDMTSTPKLFDADDGGVFVEFHVQARFAGAWHETWPDRPDTVAAKDAGLLFERTGAIRYRSKAHGAFRWDSASDWTEDEFNGVVFDDREEFLHHYAKQLAQVARAGTDAQKLWLRLYLHGCNDSADRQQVESQLPPADTNNP